MKTLASAMPLGVETPASKIATALAVLSLTFRLGVEVNYGRIGADIYTREINIITGGSGLRLPASPELTIGELQAGMENLSIMALSASALTLDETLIEVFGKLADDRDSNRHALRMMVNQLRNAFAHKPWRAKWLVFPQHRKHYPITLDDGSKFIFDATCLDGKSIAPEQVGGLEFWVKVLQHCERLVRHVER